MLEDKLQNSGNTFSLNFVEEWKLGKVYEIGLLMANIAAVYKNFMSMQQTGKTTFEPRYAEVFQEMVDALRGTIEGKRLARKHPPLFEILYQACNAMKKYSSGKIVPNDGVYHDANKMKSVLEWLRKK